MSTDFQPHSPTLIGVLVLAALPLLAGAAEVEAFLTSISVFAFSFLLAAS